jgi:hypothetical protein
MIPGPQEGEQSMNIKIKFDRSDTTRYTITQVLREAGFQVETEASPRYLDGRIYVHVSDERIEPD